jgi:hypothetical protein
MEPVGVVHEGHGDKPTKIMAVFVAPTASHAGWASRAGECREGRLLGRSCRSRLWPGRAARDPRLPRSDRTEMGPLTEEHRPRNKGAGRQSAGPSLTHS